MTQKPIIVNAIDDVKEKTATFLAIGVFDGVHRGHQLLLQSMVAAAQNQGARPALLTFSPHPGSVVNGRQGRLYLTTQEERLGLLADLGLDLIINHPFDESVRQTRAANFVDRLCRHLDLKQLWGGNFGLGYNREGDLPFLQKLGVERGFSVHQFEAMVQWDGRQVSSSRVRQALRNGHMTEVTGCLGRYFRLSGTVIPGDGRGRQLGIPTANLDVWDELVLPASGVYATYVEVMGKTYAGATNIGFRPTVDGRTLNVETHIIDFDHDLYGQEISLSFVARIRDERKFPDLDSLIRQINADIQKVSRLLSLDNAL